VDIEQTMAYPPRAVLHGLWKLTVFYGTLNCCLMNVDKVGNMRRG
jgi:hypothetical protein